MSASKIVGEAASVTRTGACSASSPWDDNTYTDPVEAEQARAHHARCKIPHKVRHREKWRLLLDMLDQNINR